MFNPRSHGHSPFHFDEDSLMDFDTDPMNPNFSRAPTESPAYDSLCPGLQDSTDYPIQVSGNWAGPISGYPDRRTHTNYPPVSTRSSHSSNARSSGNSLFSHHHVRNSAASTNTTWSFFSEEQRECNISDAERLLSANSVVSRSQSTGVPEESPNRPSHYRTSQRQSDPTKNHFTTCVSRTKRSRRSTKEPKYWCTSCSDGFGEKYDWKRHEETYQERTETYQCDLCKKTYFLEKDFVHHHQNSHRCLTCSENQHTEIARRKRNGRTGWGCGFCLRFDHDWSERCNHIAWHFEKDHKDMSHWHHTQVILSLLERPSIHDKWLQLLDSKNEANPRFAWNANKTGRSEGYPGSDHPAQLQDMLEHYDQDHDASAIVNLAYELGHRRSPARLHQPQLVHGLLQSSAQLGSSTDSLHTPKQDSHNYIHPLFLTTPSPLTISGLTRNNLPPHGDLPPPVPPKDDLHCTNTFASQHLLNDFQWNPLIETIQEDLLLPQSAFAMDGFGLDPADWAEGHLM